MSSSPRRKWAPTGSGPWREWSPTTTSSRRCHLADVQRYVLTVRVLVADLAVGAGGHHCLVPVRETDAVRGGALLAHDLDDFRDLVVLADHPAVLDKLVAHGCVHLRASSQPRARWVTAI